MKILMDYYEPTAVVEEVHPLPVPGKYMARINNAEMRVIEPYYKDQDTCIIVEFQLINVDTFESFTLIETYYPFKGNPRTDDFFEFVRRNIPDFENYDELIGIRANVEVMYEFLGGFIHPIISFRR